MISTEAQAVMKNNAEYKKQLLEVKQELNLER